MKNDLSIGDAVEVRVMRPPVRNLATRIADRLEPVEQWLPATVCHVDDSQIGVAFSDGERLAIAASQFSNIRRTPGRPGGFERKD